MFLFLLGKSMGNKFGAKRENNPKILNEIFVIPKSPSSHQRH
jgi:hypothetical protein